MKWRDIREWIQRKEPSFFDQVRGVPLDEIREVADKRGVKVPRLYVDFLLEMGLHEGKSPVFGGTDYHDFRSLNAEPADGARSKRYFKIAEHDETDDIAYIDTYLDLANGDDDDAPLVEAEAGDESEVSRYGRETKESFSLFLEKWAFLRFETKDRNEDLSMFLHMNEYKEGMAPRKGGPRETAAEYKAMLKPYSAEKAGERMQDIISVLEERGLTLALPRLPTFACMSHSNLSASVEIVESSNMIATYLSRDESSDSDDLVAELALRIPGLGVYRTWRSSRFS